VTRSAPLVTVLAANAVSQVGDMMVAIAMPWFVLETTGSVVRMGFAGAAIGAGVVVSSAAGGPVVDRLGSRRASVYSDLAAGAAVLAIPLLYVSGNLDFWQFLILVFLVAVLNAPGDLARRAMIPVLARKAAIPLERANAADTAIPRFAQLAGPILGGVLVAVLGAANVLVLDAATFFLSAALVALGVRSSTTASQVLPRAAGQDEDPGLFANTRHLGHPFRRYLKDLAESLRFLRSSGLVLSLVLVAAVANMLEKPLMSVVAPVYAESFYQGAATFGLMMAVFGAGAVVGTVIFGIVGDRLPRRLTFLVCLTLGPLLLFGSLATTPPLPALLIAIAASGLFFGPMNSLFATAVQETTSEDMLGRTFGTISALSMVGIPFGTVLIGVVAERAGTIPTLVAMGSIYLILAGVMFVNPAMEKMESSTP
jgi:MFS family permease